jgi:hypothetical protein
MTVDVRVLVVKEGHRDRDQAAEEADRRVEADRIVVADRRVEADRIVVADRRVEADRIVVVEVPNATGRIEVVRIDDLSRTRGARLR